MFCNRDRYRGSDRSLSSVGVQAFSKFNGMWAFVLHDTNSNQFIVSRDRFGKKPLYYTLYNGIYYFTSELKALLEIRRFEINPVIAAQF